MNLMIRKTFIGFNVLVMLIGVFTMIFGDLAFGALFLFFGFFIGGLALVE